MYKVYCFAVDLFEEKMQQYGIEVNQPYAESEVSSETMPASGDTLFPTSDNAEDLSQYDPAC